MIINFDAAQNLLEEKYFILPLSGGSGEGFMDAGDEESPNGQRGEKAHIWEYKTWRISCLHSPMSTE